MRPRAGEVQAALAPGVIGRILGAAVLCAFHAELTRGLLRIRPDAAIGYSSGESAALVALGAWTDPAALNHDVQASELLATDLTGEFRAVRRAWRRLGVTGERWVSYLVSAPADQVRAALGDEAAAYLMAINAPDACIIGGEASACEAVLRRLGGRSVIPIDYGIAAHAPVLADVAEEYRRLHWRPTADVPGVRFYSGATGESYRASADRAADALAAQIVGTIDFVRVIERAWADGVRVFVEHGPQAQCTGWIRRILGERAHLSVALDAPGGRGTRQLGQVVAELAAAGVGVGRRGVLRPSRRGRPRGCGQDRDDPAARPSARDAAARTRTAGVRHAPGAEAGAGGGQLQPAQLRCRAPSPRRTPGPRLSPGRRPGPGAAGAAALVALQFQNVTALHRDFLARQAQAHAEFLRARQQGVAALIAMMRGPGTPPLVPLTGPPQPLAADGRPRPDPHPRPRGARMRAGCPAPGR